MPNYRAYLIGIDGYFIKAIDLHSQDDEAAIEAARQLAGSHDVELWHRDRRIGRFSKAK